MNIIFSNYDDLQNPYYGGGGAVAIHEVARRLAMHNHVTVLTGRYPGSKNEMIDNVLYKRVGLASGSPYFDQLVFWLALPFFAIRNKYDVWLESFTPPFSTSCLQLFTSKPVIGITHLLAGKVMRQRYHLPFNLVENLGLKSYKFVIVLTEYLKNEVLRANSSLKTKIITNGLSKDIINRRVVREEKYIAFLGRIDIQQKGLDVLLKAYSMVSKKIKFPLAIAGSGIDSELNKLNNLIYKFNIQDRVELVGNLTTANKYDFLDKACFTVIPSRTEGFAIVALEAMASGSPLIISDIEGLNWIPENIATRFDIEAGPEQLAQHIEQLCDDYNQRLEISKKSKDYAKNFDWDLITEQYQSFIQEVTSTN